MCIRQLRWAFIFSLLTVLSLFNLSYAQNAQLRYTSPEVSDDQSVTFRIAAENADSVFLSSPDIPGINMNKLMEKGEGGVWEITVEPQTPGAYRYNFSVDGMFVLDPVNPQTSRSNANSWSLVNVSGNELMDTNLVPHGAVSEVTYYSESLGKNRSMHIYTPPGYQKGEGEYPVFYLLHGALDSDDSWSTVGRAGFIVDNLIATGQAEPMIIVMPDGHTEKFYWGAPLSMEDFVNDFNKDIKPYVEQNYRIKTERAATAIAGLSMGGAQTMNIAIPDLKEYAYIGVFSSGIFGSQGPGSVNAFEEDNRESLTSADAKEGLLLVWYATGKDDFLLQISRSSVALLNKYDFNVVYEETEGGHTWLNWREYLTEFVPMLFK